MTAFIKLRAHGYQSQRKKRFFEKISKILKRRGKKILKAWGGHGVQLRLDTIRGLEFLQGAWERPFLVKVQPQFQVKPQDWRSYGRSWGSVGPWLEPMRGYWWKCRPAEAGDISVLEMPVPRTTTRDSSSLEWSCPNLWDRLCVLWQAVWSLKYCRPWVLCCWTLVLLWFHCDSLLPSWEKKVFKFFKNRNPQLWDLGYFREALEF